MTPGEGAEPAQLHVLVVPAWGVQGVVVSALLAFVGGSHSAGGRRALPNFHVEIRIPLPPLLVTTSWFLPAGTSTVKFSFALWRR